MSNEKLKKDPTKDMREALFSLTVTFVKSLEAFMPQEDAKEVVASHLENLASSLRQLTEEDTEND